MLARTRSLLAILGSLVPLKRPIELVGGYLLVPSRMICPSLLPVSRETLRQPHPPVAGERAGSSMIAVHFSDEFSDANAHVRAALRTSVGIESAARFPAHWETLGSTRSSATNMVDRRRFSLVIVNSSVSRETHVESGKCLSGHASGEGKDH